MFKTAVACSFLCWIAYQRGDMASLAEWAREGERYAIEADKKCELAEFLMWQALVARRAGDEKLAQRFYRRASTRVGHTCAHPSEMYYDACCAYHEAGGELERALEVRARQLDQLVGKGQTIAECRCRLEHCQLLARMGKPVDGEIAEARQAADRLIDPTWFLEKVSRLAREN